MYGKTEAKNKEKKKIMSDAGLLSLTETKTEIKSIKTIFWNKILTLILKKLSNIKYKISNT